MKLVNGKVVAETPEEEAALAEHSEAATSGLKNKNSELLAELAKLKPLKGLDPEEFARLKKIADEKDEADKRAAGDYDALKKQIVDAHAKEIEKLKGESATLRKSLEENVLGRMAVEAITAEKGAAVLLMPHIKSRTKLDDNGNPVVIDESGNIRVNAKGEPLKITELVAEMKADVATYGRAFESGFAAGSGAGGGKQLPSGVKSITRTEFDALEPTVKSAHLKAGGQVTDQ